MPLQPRLFTPSSTPRTSGFDAHKSFILSAAAGVMVNGAGSARRFFFAVGGAVAAGAGRVLNGARAPGEPSLVLNGAAPPGAALPSVAGASRLTGGAEPRAARAAARPNMGCFWSA